MSDAMSGLAVDLVEALRSAESAKNVLGLPCFCVTPELHSDACARIRSLASKIDFESKQKESIYEIVAPTRVAADTLGGNLRIGLAGQLPGGGAALASLTFRSFFEVVESDLIDALRDGVSMMVGLGIWDKPISSEERLVN